MKKMFGKLSDFINTTFTHLQNFYYKNKIKICSSLFLLSLHPHYTKFCFNNEENSNNIQNFLTFEESKIRQISLSNISYKIFFDFSEKESECLNNNFKLTGIIKINFDFDNEKYPSSKQHLKVDYQGKVLSVYLDDKQLKNKDDYYIVKKDEKEAFLQQEKNCLLINKNILKKKNNTLLITFSTEYPEKYKNNEINNPFLFVEDKKDENKFKLLKVMIYSI